MRNAKPVAVVKALCLLLLLAGCGRPTDAPPAAKALAAAPVVRSRPEILQRLPHDPGAFTQGLLLEKDVWLESTGQYGQSELREVDRETGRVLRRLPLEDRFFGEGLARVGDRLIQVTWRERTGRVVDRNTFQELKRFSYPGQGWGLASDGNVLFLSDGSSTIRVLDPNTFAEVRRFQVRGPDGPVSRLNELEWIQGELWANVYRTRDIVRFTPEGVLTGVIDLSALPPSEDRHENQDVLNGIAYDPETGLVWVTGKYWKALYSFSREQAVGAGTHPESD